MKRRSIQIAHPDQNHRLRRLMRRMATLTVIALFIAAPIRAQRGGGARSGGATRGLAGRPGIAGGGIHSRSPVVTPNHPSASNRFSSRSPNGPGVFPGKGWNSRDSRRRNWGDCNGYNCWGYAYPWWMYSYPYWWDSYDPYYDHVHEHDHDPSYERAYEHDPSQDDQQAFEPPPMRPWGPYGYWNGYAPPPSIPRPAASEAVVGTEIISPTVLVFRNRHKREIRSYVIFGQALWNFAPQGTEKISLADLDLPATVKANEQRGISFRVPTRRSSKDGPHSRGSS